MISMVFTHVCDSLNGKTSWLGLLESRRAGSARVLVDWSVQCLVNCVCCGCTFVPSKLSKEIISPKLVPCNVPDVMSHFDVQSCF